jgi:hypothetical protein
MAQTNIISRERATYLAEEITYGTLPVLPSTFPNIPTRVFPLGDGLILEGLAEEMLPVGDERVRRLDAIHPVHGLRIASKVGSLKMLLKTTKAADQLDTSVTPSLAAPALTPRIILRHALGSEAVRQGDTISGTSSTTTLINVTDGTRFRKGTFIAVEVLGEMQFAKITNIATNALTIAPDLSTAPVIGGEIVRNLYNYCPAETHAKSLSVQQAFVGDATAQVTAFGCYGDISFDLPEYGKIPSMALALTASAFTGPAATSPTTISVASASDEMGPAFTWSPSVYLATSVARATRLVCEGATIDYANDWQMVRDPGAVASNGQLTTVAAVVSTGGRPVAVKASIKLRFDSDYPADFTADTAYQMILVQKVGTGLTASFWIWELPVAQLVAQPKLTVIGDRLHMELMLEGIQDNTVTLASPAETGTDLDFIKAPFRVAFG